MKRVDKAFNVASLMRLLLLAMFVTMWVVAGWIVLQVEEHHISPDWGVTYDQSWEYPRGE